MLSGYDDTLCNLRLVGGIKLHEYIQTDNEGNILSYLGHNFINCVSSAISGENWNSTMRCLRKLYADEMPKIINELDEKYDEDQKHCEVELRKIGHLLELSLIGLENLKSVYQNTNSISHIDTIVEDYCKNQIQRLKDIMKRSEDNFYSSDEEEKTPVSDE